MEDKEYKTISISIGVELCKDIDKVTDNRSAYLCNAAAEKIKQQKIINDAIADYAVRKAGLK